MLTNLLISRLEVRSEECPDVTPYTHGRQLEKVVVPLGDQLKAVRDKYMQVRDVSKTTCSVSCVRVSVQLVCGYFLDGLLFPCMASGIALLYSIRVNVFNGAP